MHTPFTRCIFLLAGYLPYKLAMASEKQMSLNRAVLLGIYALAFAAWPLSRIQWNATAPTAGSTFNLSYLSGGIADDSTGQTLWPVVLIALYPKTTPNTLTA